MVCQKRMLSFLLITLALFQYLWRPSCLLWFRLWLKKIMQQKKICNNFFKYYNSLKDVCLFFSSSSLPKHPTPTFLRLVKYFNKGFIITNVLTKEMLFKRIHKERYGYVFKKYIVFFFLCNLSFCIMPILSGMNIYFEGYSMESKNSFHWFPNEL